MLWRNEFRPTKPAFMCEFIRGRLVGDAWSHTVARSLALNGGGGLAGKLVTNPGDTADFIDNAIGYPLQEFIG